MGRCGSWSFWAFKGLCGSLIGFYGPLWVLMDPYRLLFVQVFIGP